MGMPKKYEREIEEILRNLERTNGSMRRKAGVRRSMPTLRLSFSEWCLVIACVAAVGAGGWAYAHHPTIDLTTGNIIAGGGNIVTGILALIGAACLAAVAIAPFVAKPRYSSSSTRYNNITQIRKGNPFRRLGTSWRLLMLKLHYRKRKDNEE